MKHNIILEIAAIPKGTLIAASTTALLLVVFCVVMLAQLRFAFRVIIVVAALLKMLGGLELMA
jgi:hypothetical protein